MLFTNVFSVQFHSSLLIRSLCALSICIHFFNSFCLHVHAAIAIVRSASDAKVLENFCYNKPLSNYRGQCAAKRTSNENKVPLRRGILQCSGADTKNGRHKSAPRRTPLFVRSCAFPASKYARNSRTNKLKRRVHPSRVREWTGRREINNGAPSNTK